MLARLLHTHAHGAVYREHMPKPPNPAEVRLEPLVRERLFRLRAEWERDSARAAIAREKFEREVATLARAAGMAGDFRLNLDGGTLVAENQQE